MKLKKNTFIQGAFIATLGIVISKILGIIYVIPFYAIIGDQGGALYGYAYNIYSIFLGISQAGLPLAMSKIISEYNALGYYETKEKAYKIGKSFLNILGLVCFLVLFIFAPQIADLIIGGVTDGNTPEDIVFVIRIISTAILVVPVLSVSRGYLQGHKFITPTPISQVIEQLVRVVIIVVGSYLMLKVFNLPLRSAVGCAVFAATIGALCSYFYIYMKIKKNKEQLTLKSKVKEPQITTKEILKKLIVYAVPFVMIDLFRSIYNSVDIITLVKALVNDFGYATKDAETVMSVISTWGLKLNMIIISIVSGMMTSLIPNLTDSFVKKDMKDVERKINQTLEVILCISLPMTIGLSFLTTPVWKTFYGASVYGPITYRYLVFVAFATTLFTASTTTLQLLKEYKMVFATLIVGLLLKSTLNIPFMHLANNLGIYPFYGAITATILGFVTSAIIATVHIKRKFNISYKDVYSQFKHIVVGVALMLLSMFLLEVFIPLKVNSRILSILIAGLYALVGGSVYLFYMYKTKTLEKVFGKSIPEKIKNKLCRKRKEA